MDPEDWMLDSALKLYGRSKNNILTDSYISKNMLLAHLDDRFDSRKQTTDGGPGMWSGAICIRLYGKGLLGNRY